MRTFDPTKKHIGLVRYGDHYHPTNQESAARLVELEDLLHCEFPGGDIPRTMRMTVARMAMEYGYHLHFFEKGLGR